MSLIGQAAARRRTAFCASTDRLLWIIHRYGKAIEYDLWVRGDDLAAMWRSRRWRHLLNIIDRLPRNSAYAEAVADDEDLAERQLAYDGAASHPRRRVSEWSPEVELLSVIADRQAELIQTVAATAGAKPRRVTPMPRPTIARDRVRARIRERKHRALVARVLPDRQ